MGNDLVSVRLLIVAERAADRELLRYGASLAPVPVEVLEAPTGRAACSIIKHEHVDMVCLDATLGAPTCAHLMAHARAARRPPFVAMVGGGIEAHDVDGEIDRPTGLDHACDLMARLLRVRLPKRALVVDDSSTVRSVVRKILAVSQFRLDTAEVQDGVTALRMAQAGQFNLVFLDCKMPGLDGLATLIELKRASRRIDVVMMDASEDISLIERARTLGAAFLKKPFYPPDIDRVLRGFYGLRMSARMAEPAFA